MIEAGGDTKKSRIFLVADASEKIRIGGLPGGTFHEIRERLTFVEIQQIHELYARKKRYKELEEQIGVF